MPPTRSSETKSSNVYLSAAQPLLTAGPTGGLLASLAGQVFRVGQRAARSLPERRSAKFRRADSICWSKVADARKRPDWERPRLLHALLAAGC